MASTLLLYTQNITRHAISWTPPRGPSLSGENSNTELLHAIHASLHYALDPCTEHPDESASFCFSATDEEAESLGVRKGGQLIIPKEADLKRAKDNEGEITVKMFFFEPPSLQSTPKGKEREKVRQTWIAEALTALEKATGKKEIARFIVKLKGVRWDGQDKWEEVGMPKVEDVCGLWETLSCNPSIKTIGVSDFSAKHLYKLYSVIADVHSAKPVVTDHLNLFDCDSPPCMNPPDDVQMAAAKKGVELVAHSDPHDILPTKALTALLTEFQERLPLPKSFKEYRDAGNVDQAVAGRWVIRYTVLIRARGLLVDRGELTWRWKNDIDSPSATRALALSLGEHSGINSPISISDDSDQDEDLLRAIKLSKAGAPREPTSLPRDTRPSSATTSSTVKASLNDTPLSKPNATQPVNFLSDRATLEKERLARQKRHLETTEAASSAPPNKRVRTAPAVAIASLSSSISTSKHPSINAELFLDGEVRQNRNAHVPKNPARPVFGMAEILTPVSELRFVLTSAFGTDFEWLRSMIPAGVPLLSINHPTDRERWEPQIKPLPLDGWIYATPKMNKGGIMHVKLLLLFYKNGRLRLVIPTANLVPDDWRDIENTMFLQDIPAKNKDSSAEPHPFPVYLASFLKILNVHNGLSALVQGGYPNLPLPSLDALATGWDWSRVTAQLVGSPAGSYEDWDSVRRWGHPRLGEAVRQLKAQPPTGKRLNLEYQGSSIGNYTTQYLNDFYKSGCGLSPDVSKRRPKAQPWPAIQIVYPSLTTVDNTVLGRLGAGSFFCRKQYWSKPNAPRKLFRDSRARSGRVLMHTKMIVGTFVDPAENGAIASTPPATSLHKGKGRASAKSTVKVPEPGSESDTDPELSDVEDMKNLVGWVYVGSHNFSMAAWGSVSGTLSKPKLWISNFELGVVLPVRDEAWLDRAVPWERPAPGYGKGDVPWMQEEHLYKLAGVQSF
ncbi:phospholipase D/nuclease [Dacryopinax primogenitus]|uniref:Phospholipase D/nuclease n=1 Tax=Dacryopinax primogenitus (strain DJM 731) TaxID=1858805 RepID=M5G3L4_DACPD|nr:phospholipase D/nuclease [Dacryopinax primogenitus]EJU04821.1 phospholipase D/nuclease [Dacryopinax primogenitus]